jgi:hypothetical protein
MTITSLSPIFVQKFFDNNGNPLANGKVYTYQAGTTTPVATYTDSTGGTANTNPIILNARGECEIWLLPNVGYKFVLQDSLGNTINTTDQVFNNQLLTLYGGTDTGTANAYVLNFTASFSSYIDGTVIYFISANTNTGPSTINVNGLGIIGLVNQGGASLSTNQIIGGTVTQVLIKGGQALLVSSGTAATVTSGNMTVTYQGFSGTVSGNGLWQVIQNVCTIRIPNLYGTSNATSFTATFSVPSIQPLTSQYISIPAAQDASTNLYSQVATIKAGAGSITQITFYKNGGPSGWTASGTKGLGEAGGGILETPITYYVY